MGTSDGEGKQGRRRAGAACDGDEGRDHTPFFEVSKIVESPDMLKGWVEWFKRLNIPCAVMKTYRLLLRDVVVLESERADRPFIVVLSGRS